MERGFVRSTLSGSKKTPNLCHTANSPQKGLNMVKSLWLVETLVKKVVVKVGCNGDCANCSKNIVRK